MFTVKTSGSGGTCAGLMRSQYGTTMLLAAAPTAVAVNTTVVNLVEFTFAAGTTGNTWTFYNATIEQVV